MVKQNKTKQKNYLHPHLYTFGNFFFVVALRFYFNYYYLQLIDA